MELKEQLEVQSKLIKQLSEENEKLKKEKEELLIDFELYKNDYNDSLTKANQIIMQCEAVMKTYTSLIEEVKILKEEYKNQCDKYHTIKKELKEISEKQHS